MRSRVVDFLDNGGFAVIGLGCGSFLLLVVTVFALFGEITMGLAIAVAVVSIILGLVLAVYAVEEYKRVRKLTASNTRIRKRNEEALKRGEHV